MHYVKFSHVTNFPYLSRFSWRIVKSDGETIEKFKFNIVTIDFNNMIQNEILYLFSVRE